MVSTDILDTHLYVWVFFFFFPFQFLAWTESSKIDLPCPNADTWQSQCNFYQKLTVSSSASRNTNSHTLSMPFMLQPASKFPGQINSILGAFVERGKVTVSFWCFFFFFWVLTIYQALLRCDIKLSQLPFMAGILIIIVLFLQVRKTEAQEGTESRLLY